MWMYLFIAKYLKEDYKINITPQKLKQVCNQMIKEELLTRELLNDCNNFESDGSQRNPYIEDITSKIAVYLDSDNYKKHPTTIKITMETKDKLESLKKYKKQSYEEVIVNLIKTGVC